MNQASSPVITAWIAVSACGLSQDSFRAVLQRRAPNVSALDENVWRSPLEQACLVPDFDPEALLGRKMARAMDRATALAVVAVGKLLESQTPGENIPGVDGETGVVLGTSTGSVASIMGFTRDSLTQKRPYLVDPARFPNTVMNCAAGRCAIAYKLRGPNATIAGGTSAALLVLNYARRLQRASRARSLVCGAVEEFSSERAWLEWQAAQARSLPSGEALLGEGCAALLIESKESSRGAQLAEILAVELQLARSPEQAGEQLQECVKRAFETARVSHAELWAVSTSSPSHHIESEAVRKIVGEREIEHLPSAALLGDTWAASGMLQIALLLAYAETSPHARDRLALVTSLDREGIVGCALLRILEGAGKASALA